MRLTTPPLSDDAHVIRPQDGPQVQFMTAKADIVIYGGAAGGGKTWALLLDAAYYAAVKPKRGYNAVIFRRTAPQIKMPGGLWSESRQLYPLLHGRPNKTDFTWEWPEQDTSVKFAHMQYDDNCYDWQGSQIAYIAFDELTHFGERAFFYLLSRNRSTCGIKPRMRATVNPDPDSWVKRFLAPWVDRDYPWHAAPGQVLRFYRENEVTYWLRTDEAIPAHIHAEDIKTGAFIPARLEDNPALMKADPGYRANIMALDPVERERLSGGPLAWDIRPSGNMFKRHWFHVVEAAPAALGETVRYWDFAGTEPRKGYGDPDYTCGVKMAAKPGGGYIILDVILERLSPGGVETLVKETALADGKKVIVRWEQEPGSSGKKVTEDYISLLDGWDCDGVRSTGDKVTRARAFSAQVQAGNVDMLQAPWNEPYLNMVCAFPNPRIHDDAVDASDGAHSQLVELAAGPRVWIDEDDGPRRQGISYAAVDEIEPLDW